MHRCTRFHLILVCLSALLLVAPSSSAGQVPGPASVAFAGPPEWPGESAQHPLVAGSSTNGSWETIVNESFDGEGCRVPCPGWSLVDVGDDSTQRQLELAGSGDEGERGYRPRISNSARWLAENGMPNSTGLAGGVDSHNRDTRLIYGPFDLSHATDARVEFQLLYESAADSWVLSVEVSSDGSHFEPLQSWSHSSLIGSKPTGRVLASVSLRDYTGYGRPGGAERVWVAWRFQGEGSGMWLGPRVEDVNILKLVPGYVNVHGWVNYYNRQGNKIPARGVSVSLMEYDVDGHIEFAGSAQTGSDGSFHIDGVLNQDWDMWDSDSRLDLYIIVAALGWDSGISFHQVTTPGGSLYTWNDNCVPDCVSWNVADGDVQLNYDVGNNDPTKKAMWLFRDARRAWEYVDQTQTDPGSVTLTWADGANCYLLDRWICNSFFYAAPAGAPFAFIRDDVTGSSDTVVHEIGHYYMYNANTWWYWYDSCREHDIWQVKEESCAWSEGWADFFPLVVNGDYCYDKVSGPCGGAGQQQNVHYYDLENQHRSDGWPQGPAVEGRVAGALYDLWDSANEGFDVVDDSFDSMWIIVRDRGRDERSYINPSLDPFSTSWRGWGHDWIQFLSVSYQNGIYGGLRWNLLPHAAR